MEHQLQQLNAEECNTSKSAEKQRLKLVPCLFIVAEVGISIDTAIFHYPHQDYITLDFLTWPK